MSISTIQHLGYSEKESRIYLALLELGSSPASTIARFLDENRITIYSILKILVKKGIVFESKKHNIQIYTALSPELLADQEKNKYEQLLDSLPGLISLVNSHRKKPKVTFYEGFLGLKSLMREVIKNFKEKPNMSLHGFLGAKEMDIQFEEFLRNALEKDNTKPKEAPTHVIIVGAANYWYADYCKQNYKTKIVDELTFPMKHEIFTYEDKVIILMYQSTELSGIIIESESLAQGIRSMFELVWKYVPETTEKI